ncbi:MAG TPA: hypothetical protein VMT82_02650 [candidate division Zixibacteria bacterium]|nr:hypothetical protein [candidate division Zixibacteria bacterium]
MQKHLRAACILAFVVCVSIGLMAATAERAVFVRAAVIYISPDSTSAKLATADRGREAAILEKSNEWAHIIATLPPALNAPAQPLEEQQPRSVTGWVLSKGLITASTPKGDEIMFGEAVDSESEASRRGGRRGAAGDARRLYARTAEYFPNSPLAAEAAYRAADIQWQLDKSDLETRPSARARDPRDRMTINDELMRQVEKKYRGTKWSDLAAFHLVENKLCGDWAAQSKCPEKEAEVYEKYVQDHPNSPAAPEALYDAAYRYAALIEIYKVEGNANKAPGAAQRAIATAQRISGKNPNPDWNARAQRLIYMVQNNIPVYGSNLE